MDSNMNEVIKKLEVKIEGLKNPDKMLRTVALSTLSSIHRRVHTDGKATDGSLIGSYSKSYLTVRSGNFQNATRWKRGDKKGHHKDAKKLGEAGAHIKGRNLGGGRPIYNRGTDPKVVLSLTRYMENDLSVVAISNGYGIGYKNPENLKKARWAEATYKKKIWGLSQSEEVAIGEIARSFVKEVLND